MGSQAYLAGVLSGEPRYDEGRKKAGPEDKGAT
jgi:hypothetical protein